MTIYEMAKQNDWLGEEIICFDTDYDIEFYMYPEEKCDSDDPFDIGLDWLCKHLEVAEVIEDRFMCTVKVTKMIEDHIAALKKSDLFYISNVEDIVCSFPSIVAGYVDEEWMEKFVSLLK